MRIDSNFISFLYYREYKDDIMALLMESYSNSQNFNLDLKIIRDFGKINFNTKKFMIDCPELKSQGRCLIVNTNEIKDSDNCRVLIGINHYHTEGYSSNAYINYFIDDHGNLISNVYGIHISDMDDEQTERQVLLREYDKTYLQSLLESDCIFDMREDNIPKFDL